MLAKMWRRCSLIRERRDVKRCGLSGEQFSVSCRAKPATAVWPGSHSPRILSQKWTSMLTPKHYMNIYRSFIRNSQKLEQPVCPSRSEWLNRQQCVCLTEQTLRINKGPRTGAHNLMNCQRITEWKFPIPKAAAHDHVHIKVLKRQIYRHVVSPGYWFLGESKRVPEKHLFLLYWLCQSLWLCGSQ